MFLADGGNIPFSALSDQFTTHSWASLGLDSHSLFGIQSSDFEVIDGGDRIALTYDCVRNNIQLETCPLAKSSSAVHFQDISSYLLVLLCVTIMTLF